MGLEYRMCQPGDEERLALFHREARGKVSSPGFWRWKYFENPAGHACIALALEGGRVVGRVGFLPVRIRIDSQCVLAGQHIDSDILEGYRGAGAYLLLARMAAREGRSRGVAFGFGFGTEATKSVSTGLLDFRLVAPVGRLVKVLNYPGYLGSKLSIRTGRLLGRGVRKLMQWKLEDCCVEEIKVFEVAGFDGRFGELSENVSLGRIRVLKDPTYLHWRYRACPTVNYTVHAVERRGVLRGFIVFHVREDGGLRRGTIDDLVCPSESPDVTKCLLDSALRTLLEEGAVTAACWFERHQEIYGLLLKGGFRPRPVPNYLLVASHGNEEACMKLVNKEANWFYVLGDSDYHLNVGEGNDVPDTNLSFH